MKPLIKVDDNLLAKIREIKNRPKRWIGVDQVTTKERLKAFKPSPDKKKWIGIDQISANQRCKSFN